MADDALILEHLKSIQATLARHGEQLTTVIERIGSLERNVAALHVDFANLSSRTDSVDTRLERVERRLDLIPAE
ncbi:MAG: hypothetical protein HQ483_11580 [Rhodospirillales bacterium]|nr:hypothetical protein [Rhodospirillales bacterium]